MGTRNDPSPDEGQKGIPITNIPTQPESATNRPEKRWPDCSVLSGDVRDVECDPLTKGTVGPCEFLYSLRSCRFRQRRVDMEAIKRHRGRASNEIKLSHRWRERAWRRDEMFESWKTWSYAGQWL